MICPRRERGFALLETLVAVGVIAMVMGMTFRTVSANAQAARMMADRRAAVLIAQSALEAASGSASDVSLERGGRERGLRWEVTVEPYGGEARDSGVPLQRVTVTVESEASRRPLVRLGTLRLAT